ncbi:amino acid permease [Solilutibacter silvestris]|uniref:Arginine/agmatine antiporter n=1 Tax=Solilutibacter silvestris TaxID=1645665 RepID=A0A2K1Q3V9_9GAMM|nr:amino acid permease [Lysobacter silvestris]PNS09703.1 Amino acid transporter [Lysobacter silvestris]
MNRRALGIWSATALVVGNMIGSGVFLLPASLAPFGATALIGWAITLTGTLALAATFARLAMKWPHTGGPYAFARAGFGDAAGFLVAWSYWVSIWSAIAAISVAFAGSVGALFPALAATPVRSAACALFALWACLAINLAGIREAGRAQIVLTAMKFVPLLLFALVAVWFINRHNLVFTHPVGMSFPAAINATAALTLWAMLGFESATVPAGDTENPERTIPRATVFGALLAGVVTVLACTAVTGIVAPDLLRNSSAPMADAARQLWGNGAGVAIAALMAVACLGALNGWVLLSAQVPLAAARDGFLPAAFARLDANGTPRFALVASSLLSTFLIVANYTRSLVQLFTFSILLSTAATLLPYLAGAGAWLRRGDRRGRVVAAIGLAFALYAISGIGQEALLWGAALLLAGAPVYWWMRRRA